MTPSHWDAIVIGAGPAGALVARQLAPGQRSVLLVDKKRFPRPKVCGACINARAISALQAAGLESVLEQTQSLQLREIEILAEGRLARLALPLGLAIGRAEFDQALADAAIAAGVVFRDGTTGKVGPLCASAREVMLEGVESTTVTASVVIAADGLQHSCLSRDATFASDVAANSLIGLGATIPQASYDLEPGLVRMMAGRGGYVGIVGLSGGRLNVAAAVESAQLRQAAGPGQLIQTLMRSADVAIPESLVSGQWHGTGALTRETRRVADSRLFLLGDATGYVEPFTGEGIAWALCSALLAAPLAEACLAGTESPELLAQQWQALHAAEVRRRQGWCRRLAWVLRTPWRRRWALAAAAAFPRLAGGIARQVSEPFALPTAPYPHIETA